MEENKKPLTLKETNQIVDVLYKWLKKIPELPCELAFEKLESTGISLTFTLEKGGGKSNYNVIGDYDGIIIFSIIYKISSNSTNERLNAFKVLNYIGEYLEIKTEEKELPVIDEKNTSKKVGILDTPSIVGVEQNYEIYQAQFEFVYRHKRF